MAEKDKKSSASFVPFRPLDSLFEPTIQEQPSPAKNGLSDLTVDDLYSFKDHPFRQYTEACCITTDVCYADTGLL